MAIHPAKRTTRPAPLRHRVARGHARKPLKTAKPYDNAADIAALSQHDMMRLVFNAMTPPVAATVQEALLSRYAGFWDLTQADDEALVAAGLKAETVTLLKAMGRLALRGLREPMMHRPYFHKRQDILDYCRAAMMHEKREQLRLIYLDRKNHVMDEEIFQTGTIDHVPVYPREIVQRALEVGAGALIMVHNHPSGDCAPSREDCRMTTDVVAACKLFDIVVHDHLIIAHQGVFSFSENGLLK